MAIKQQTTPIKVTKQGGATVSSDLAYGLVNSNIAALNFDLDGRAWVDWSSVSENGCPILYISPLDDYSGEGYTVVEFPEFSGWIVHSTRGGKIISLCLAKRIV